MLREFDSPSTRSRAAVGSGRSGRGGGRSGSYSRSAPLGRPHRTGGRGHGRATLALLLIAGALAVAAGFVFTRPLSASIDAKPVDANIRFEAASGDTTQSLTSRGSLEATGLASAAYRVTVWRTGFETRTTEIDVRRFHVNKLHVVLDPLPQRIVAHVQPKGASIRITRLDGGNGQEGVLNGTTDLEGTLLTGKVRVECTLKGRNGFTRELYLDRPTTLNVFLDPKGQLVHNLGTITTAGAPKGVVVTPNGKEAWATILNGPPSIEILDLATQRRSGVVNIGKYGAVELEFTRDGRFAYASQMETAKVFEIDTASRKVTRSFDTKSAWTKVVELSPDEKTLYAANWSGDDVSEIDLATGKLRRRIPVADTPRGLYATRDGKSLYVAGFGRGDLERVDLESGEVTKLFKSGGALRHLVADESTQRLYASDMAKDCVYVCDMKTGKVTRLAGVDEKPNTIDLSPDGRVLFVSCRGENNAKSYYIPGPEWGTILLLDARTGKPLDAIVGGNQCTALDVSDDGKTLAFSDFLDDRLRIYEVPSYAKLAKGGGGRYEAHFADLKK